LNTCVDSLNDCAVYVTQLTVRTVFALVVAMQMSTLLLILASINVELDESEFTKTSPVKSRDTRRVGNSGSDQFNGCVIGDVLMAAGRHELDDVAQIREDGMLLAEAVVNATRSTWNDQDKIQFESAGSANISNNPRESVTTEVDRRLERLLRVTEFARYQLINSVGSKKIEPAATSLTELVVKLKLVNRTRRHLEQLNIYELEAGEYVLCSSVFISLSNEIYFIHLFKNFKMHEIKAV